jgi:hypothetical protein
VPALDYTVRAQGTFYRPEIPFRYTNWTSDTLVLTGCHPPSEPHLEWWDGEEWRSAFDRIELLCLSSPFAIPPGTIIDDTVRVNVSRDPTGPGGRPIGPHWKASHGVGEYRLMWPLQKQASPAEHQEGLGGAPRPVAERVSNVFRLTIATP